MLAGRNYDKDCSQISIWANLITGRSGLFILDNLTKPIFMEILKHL